jgi:hypothetical protein
VVAVWGRFLFGMEGMDTVLSSGKLRAKSNPFLKVNVRNSIRQMLGMAMTQLSEPCLRKGVSIF